MPILLEKLKRIFPDLDFKPNFLLSQISYSKIGGPAEVFVEVKREKIFIELIKYCRQESIPHTIVGGASNVIFADEGVKGLVVRYSNDSIEIAEKKTEYSVVKAGSGIKMSLLVKKLLEWNLEGLEYFLGVPGLLGGAVYNNAHYLSDLLSEHIESVKVLSENGQILWLSHADCQFSYDYSRFQKTEEIILEVKFKLKKGDEKTSRELIQKATEYRATTQPLGTPSSGCIFQNVPNNSHLRELFPQFADKDYVSGGFLIDQAGLKGGKIGDIQVSEKHAAFLVNTGKGTAKDLQKLITKVKKRVRDKFNVELKEEVFYI